MHDAAPESPHDFRVQDLAGAVVRLRPELIFRPQSFSGRPGYVIEDPVHNKFFRVGLPEYHFVSHLDGRTSVRRALAINAGTQGSDALTLQDAATLCQWLIESGLAHSSQSANPDRLQRTASAARRKAIVQKVNPITLRVPLIRSDRYAVVAGRYLRWLFTLPAVLAVLMMMAVAGLQVAVQWDRFTASAAGIFSPDGWLGLLAGWIVLKVIHELGHAIVCRKYGGRIRETGLLLILFLPIPYVDATTSWRFRSKWHRIATALAGMYLEFIVAALAAAVWSVTAPGGWNQLAANVVLMATATTLLFNANPLMRFDGYYVLVDLLEIPNLYSSGSLYLKYLVRRYLFGTSAMLPPWPPRDRPVIKAYALAALAWRVLICISLIIPAAKMFYGAGVVLAAGAVVLWAIAPLVRFANFLIRDDTIGTAARRRFLIRTFTATSLAGVLFVAVPWPWSPRAPGVVEFAPLHVVRAESGGFVSRIHVHSGQKVERGQLLVELHDKSLDVELAEFDLALDRSRLESRGYRTRHEMAKYQAELKKAESLEKQRREKELQLHSLQVLAPADGRVMRRNLESLQGQYLAAGDEILAIGNEVAKEIQVAVSESDVDWFHSALGQTVRVVLSNGDRLEGPLTKVTPRGSVSPLHPSLCAVHGGPLVVRKRSAAAGEKVTEDERLELIEPHFTATVAVAPVASEALWSGQRASVRLAERPESIGDHLWRIARRWLRDKAR